MESTCTLFCQDLIEITRFGGDSALAVLHGHPISLYRVVKPLGVGYELVARCSGSLIRNRTYRRL